VATTYPRLTEHYAVCHCPASEPKEQIYYLRMCHTGVCNRVAN